jgi:hypothetical protein
MQAPVCDYKSNNRAYLQKAVSKGSYCKLSAEKVLRSNEVGLRYDARNIVY